MSDTNYVFREKAADAGAPMLLLFHGTGGDENQFFGLGGQLMPKAQLVAPRGDVSEMGANRYFRRTGEGRYDMADLARATAKMAGFIDGLREASKPSLVAGLGYSNGANILASVLLARPELIERAVLLHPLIPFAPPPAPGLSGRRILISAGRRDPMAPADRTLALAEFLTSQGAAVELTWHEGGHDLRQEELEAARRFLA
jgi:phospholipase/carboxylesterase